VNNLEKVIKNHINLRGKINGLKRTDTFKIPEPAIREVLGNALIHRDYSNLGRDIKIAIIDDKLSIISPGGLPNSIAIDEILFGRSEIRNKIIAKIFKKLNLIEQWGTGIQCISSLCKEAGDFVEFTFFRNNKSNNSIRKTTKVAESKDNPTDYDRLTTKKLQKSSEKQKCNFGFLSREQTNGFIRCN